ncbi:methyltransferase domain-containing protein [Aeromicrobium sp. CTD01-1L150]|uniref:methyltransferase domain-containing protein n=1 Tax=Aeromicrobium sp. CTD01-1L150 TaxID=3341830 RepID=UPI0035BF4AA0
MTEHRAMRGPAPRWDPSLYLRHGAERSRPFLDLVGRIAGDARTVVDLGCGPGHLSAVLRERWPQAHVHGIDSSAEMIGRAQQQNTDPSVTFEQADVSRWYPDPPVDVMVSNALFQWVRQAQAVVTRLAEHVVGGGTFALQVPHNFEAPSHVLLHEIASRPPYAEHTEGLHEARGSDAGSWLELFAGLGWRVDAWTTTYQHVLPGDDPVFSWISGTGARPILQALPDGLRARFEREYRAALRTAYPRRPWGTVLPFERVFVVAQRPQA